MEVSFIGLMKQLCEHHAESITETRRFSYQPFHEQGLSNQQVIKQFRKTAHNAYFEYLKKLDSEKKITASGRADSNAGLNHQFVQLLSWVIVLLRQNKFDDAQQLQQIVQKLLEFDSSELEPILRFLLCLAGSAKEKKHVLGYQNSNYKWKKTSSYPLAGLDYIRDTQKYSTEKASFLYYPSFTRDMFEVNGLDCSLNWQSIFSKTPGEGLSKCFNVSNVMNDCHEQLTQSTLFGALTQRNVYNLDLKLELPDLIPKQQRFLTFRNPSCYMSDVTSCSSDEGYREFSPTDAGVPDFDLYQSDSAISLASSSSKSIWELALNFEPSKHYTWEVVGEHPGLKEHPYLSEAGPKAVDELFTIKLNELSLFCPSLKKPCKVFVSVSQLVQDILYLLIGVPSQTFHLNKDEKKFYVKDWICVSGLTPTALGSMLNIYVESGTIYHRLSLLSHPLVYKFSDGGGLTSQAFIRAINNFLQYYRARILSLPTDITLLQLNFSCHRLMKQMRFMSDLCKCDPYDDTNRNSNLFVGLKLLNYLYKNAVEAWDTDNYFLLLSLFQSSCIPFALYLQNWIFHGVCKDEYGEFMIKISENIIYLTGKENWRMSFQLETSGDNIPEFLSDIIPDIFSCGLSLNLLRICCPQHFICNVDCNDVPQVQFFHSRAELKELQQYSMCYFSRMNQIAAQRIQSRQERRDELVRMKEDLAIKARKVAADELKQITDEIEAVKKIQQDKKQKELKFLKEQMEEAEMRKSQEKQQAKEETKREAELLNHKEQALLKAKAMMEEEIKERIIKHYADLSEQATLQEERALWHVRRSRLDTVRMEFFAEDEKKWKTEMEKWKRNSKLAEENVDGKDYPLDDLEADHNLPQWAKQDSRNISSLDDVEVEQDNLPSWAEKKLESELIQPADQLNKAQTKKEDIFSKDNLPSWALKGSHGEGPEGDDVALLDSVVTTTPQFGLSKAGGDPPSEELQVLKTKQPKSKPEPSEVLAKHPSGTINITESSSESHQQIKLQKHVEGQSVSKETAKDAKVVQSRKGIDTQSISQENFGSLPDQKLISLRKPVENQSISKETLGTSPGDVFISRRKAVEGQSVMKEAADTSKGEQVLPHRKHVYNQSITKETQDTAAGEQVILRRKRVDNQCILKETADMSSGDQVIPRRKRIDAHSVGKESSESTLNYRHSGIFISSSLVTQGNYEIEPPAWKQPEELYAQETDMKDFSIRRMSGVYPTDEFSPESTALHVHRSQAKTHNKMSLQMSATTESEMVDNEKLLRERFKQRNVHGHSSDSTIQKLLYGRKFGVHNEPADKVDTGNMDTLTAEEAIFKAWKNSLSEPYETEFDFEGERLINIGRDLTYIFHGRSGIRSKACIKELEAYQHTPLPILIQRSILTPINLQIELVNKCALDYFLVELSLDEHFTAFWNYLIMGDGDFAQNLTDLLFEKLSNNPHPNEVLNPMFLNGMLRKALKSSICCVDKYTENLSFEVVQKPSSLVKEDGNQILECLNLVYKVKWPLNIVITEECHEKYRQLYSFLLQLKQAIWLLQQIWRQMKQDASINHVGQMHHMRKHTQFHRVQTFQHIMRELVRALQHYFVNQVLHLSWTEFQEALNSKVHNLDDLHQVHMDFLNISIKRSLLTQQASHVRTMIKQLLNLIKSFYQTLTCQRWYQDPSDGGTIKHPYFSRLLKLYEEFTKYSKVFFKVISGLAQRRYEPHLQDLVLLLNFNNWFTDSS